MSKPALYLLALLVGSAITVVAPQSVHANPPYCTFVPDRVYVFSTGDLAVYATNGEGFSSSTGGAVYICNISSVYCQHWHETLIAASLAAKTATIMMTDATKACTALAEESKTKTKYVRLN